MPGWPSFRKLLFGQGAGDECAGSDAALEIALGEELRVGVEDREAGDAQFCSEFTAGGDALTGAEVAAQDRRAVAVVNLLVQRVCRPAVDGDYRQNSCGCAAHNDIIVVSTNRP